MKKEKKAIVVGAGLVGTLWAILLAKRGYAVEVYERRGDIRRADIVGGRSINLAMSTRGWRALEKAGIKDKIRKVAIPMHGRKMHEVSGDLAFQPYSSDGQSIYSVSRAGLNLELMNIADQYDNVQFFFEHKCLDLDTRQFHLTFEDKRSGEVKEVTAPLIFGTDGAYSAIRYSLQKTPRFNFQQQFLDYGYKELSIPPTPSGDFAMDPNALHIWPRGRFMLIGLPNQDRSFTGTLFLSYEGAVAFENLKTDEQIMAFFEEYFPDAIPLMPNLLEDFHQNPTASLVTIRCAPWQYRQRVLLMGDASHAIVPFYGQGMNSGFEDCSLLDDLCDLYKEDWDQILPAFSKKRVPDANAIADLALRNFIEMRDLVSDPPFLLRKKIEKHLERKFPEQFLSVYSMVTFSNKPYSEALKETSVQDALFQRILAMDEIESRWNSEEVEQVFLNWIEEQNLVAAG
ncbi:MAG: NAD(P)/FAD-dependent oxidoreductase [Bacteroidota bacterium]